MLGLKDRKSLRERYLLPALQGGYIEMTHPDTPSSRNQKYRLTLGDTVMELWGRYGGDESMSNQTAPLGNFAEVNPKVLRKLIPTMRYYTLTYHQ